MESLIETLAAGSHLGPRQIEHAVASLVSGEVPDGLKMEFLKSLRAKGETAEEIAGFAQALLAHAVDPGLDPTKLQGPTLDVCGTGGDRQGFFNVSTAVMFVAAACGACVMKHGNRSVTSKTGAADVLEELGVKIDLAPAELRVTLEQHGLAFIFAPAFHPAFKSIGPIRKALAAQGVATIFNLLGPLLNPARPRYQLAGLFHPDLLSKYAGALHALGRQRAWAVHGSGTDELTLTGPSVIVEVDQTRGIREFTITPEQFGLQRCAPEDLRGGERTDNARILEEILSGIERGPKRDMVLLNAAAACVVCELAPDLPAGLEMARTALDSGTAMAKLNALRGRT